MASAFKNAGMSVVTTDNASANLYTASGVTAVVHAVYISNKSSSNEANLDVKVTTDGSKTGIFTLTIVEADDKIAPTYIQVIAQ